MDLSLNKKGLLEQLRYDLFASQFAAANRNARNRADVLGVRMLGLASSFNYKPLFSVQFRFWLHQSEIVEAVSLRPT